MSSQPCSPIPKEDEMGVDSWSSSSTINELEPETVVLGSQPDNGQQSEPNQMSTEERISRPTAAILIHSEEGNSRKVTMDSNSLIKDSAQTVKGKADTHSLKHGFDGSGPSTSHSVQPPTTKETLPELPSFPCSPRSASPKADEGKLIPPTTSVLEGTPTPIAETDSPSQPRKTDDRSNIGMTESTTECTTVSTTGFSHPPNRLVTEEGRPCVVCQASDDVELEFEQNSDDVDDGGQDEVEQSSPPLIYDDVRGSTRVLDPESYSAQPQRVIATIRERGALVPQEPVTIPIPHTGQQNQPEVAAPNVCVTCREPIHATPPSRLDVCLRCNGTVCSNCLDRVHFCLFFRCVDCLSNVPSSLFVRSCPICRGRICLDCDRYWAHRCTPG